jgi:O-acetyl-ADP-ribose deacetylase (regulator of RNase III)
MIKYFQGDVLKSSAQVIAHGCNCRGGFGAGIAQQILRQFPRAEQAYMSKFKTEGWHLGEVQIVKVGPEKFIANCATQDRYGSPKGGKVYADYGAIKEVMIQLKDFCQEYNYQLAVPKIGAGLAGGDWNTIAQIINEVCPDMEVWVFEL